MKFFADTASLEEIVYCFDNHVDDGITTNPKIIECTGDLSCGFEKACKLILEKYPNTPVSLETDLRGIDLNEIHNKPREVSDILYKQAIELASWGSNVVVKIPICKGGLLTTEALAEQGIKTNVTACMTPYQALEAASAGATYVSLFANRILDSHILQLSGHSLDEIIINPIWKKIVAENKEKYFDMAWMQTLQEIAYVAGKLDGTSTQLIVGSIRTPEDILKIIQAEPQIITIPTKIVKDLKNCGKDIEYLKQTKRTITGPLGDSLYHPMTDYTLAEFEKAADSYRKK